MLGFANVDPANNASFAQKMQHQHSTACWIWTVNVDEDYRTRLQKSS